MTTDVLPIEEVPMPTEDVSDLKDVFDAINRLCETMKNSTCEPEYVECEEPDEVIFKKMKIFPVTCDSASVESGLQWSDLAAENVGNTDETGDTESGHVGLSLAGNVEWRDSQASLANSEISVHREHEERWRDIVSSEASKPEQWKDSQASLVSSEASVQRDVQEERWSDTLTSPPSSDMSATKESRERWSDCRSPPDIATSDTEVVIQCELASEYFTASSEVSLSDTEQREGDKVVMAGHVAAMRERFESMTRANTPCPDLMRSASPSLDVFRNITPSPDRLG